MPLARYAAQEQEVVPIVEPQVLMDAAHDADRCAAVTEYVLKTVFQELYEQRVVLEGMVLKPNMVIAGKNSLRQASVNDVAEKTLMVLMRGVPSAVPGIAFLSGGQSDEEATAHLNAMNRIGGVPWRLTFSYGRALQAAPQKAWSGKADNVAVALELRKELLDRIVMTTLDVWFLLSLFRSVVRSRWGCRSV
jgi:fructose-bisphosphate aldolase class I